MKRHVWALSVVGKAMPTRAKAVVHANGTLVWLKAVMP